MGGVPQPARTSPLPSKAWLSAEFWVLGGLQWGNRSQPVLKDREKKSWIFHLKKNTSKGNSLMSYWRESLQQCLGIHIWNRETKQVFAFLWVWMSFSWTLRARTWAFSSLWTAGSPFAAISQCSPSLYKMMLCVVGRESCHYILRVREMKYRFENYAESTNTTSRSVLLPIDQAMSWPLKGTVCQILACHFWRAPFKLGESSLKAQKPMHDFESRNSYSKLHQA